MLCPHDVPKSYPVQGHIDVQIVERVWTLFRSPEFVIDPKKGMIGTSILCLVGSENSFYFWAFSALLDWHSEERTGEQRQREKGPTCGKGLWARLEPAALSSMACGCPLNALS